jgi:flagellin-like protein
MVPAILSKKAITPIIAVILLLMMTVAAAGGAFYWTSRVQGQMQGGTESYQSQLFERMAGKVEVQMAQYAENSTIQNLSIFFKNTGNIKVPIVNSSDVPTTTWILKDPNQKIVCSTNWNTSRNSNSVSCIEGCGASGTSADLDISEIQKVVLEFANFADATKNKTSSCLINTSTYATGALFSFTVDFGGKATATGSFMK